MPDVLLGIFPHPDDEAYAAGATFAAAAAGGTRVEILSATGGERGQNFLGEDPRPLAQIRSEELAASCRRLGARPPRFLDLPDGGLGGVDFPAVVAEIVAVIRELRPAVVITLGKDGAYGHPDHVALHRLVIAAARSAAGGDRFPAARLGEPHQIERLYFCAFPPGLFRPQYEQMLTTDLADVVRQVDPNRLGTPAGEVVVSVPAGEFAAQKLAALACHRSQYPGEDPRAIFPPGIVESLLRLESFTLGSEVASEPSPDGVLARLLKLKQR